MCVPNQRLGYVLVRITRKFDAATNVCMLLLKHCRPLIDFDYPLVIIRVARLLLERCVSVSWFARAACVYGLAVQARAFPRGA